MAGTQLTERARCYLTAWENGGHFSRGLAYSELVAEASLDYSLGSLERVDALLDRIRNEHGPAPETLLDAADAQNLLYLLAFHAGEVVARARGQAAEWWDWRGFIEQQTYIAMGSHFLNSAQCLFVGNDTGPRWFMPLHALTLRLFDANAPGVSVAAHAFVTIDATGGDKTRVLPPVEPVAAAISWPPAERLDSTECASYLAIDEPGFLARDAALGRLFAQFPHLLKRGRVVWSAVVQANNDLFDIGSLDAAPAAVVYDPSGRTSLNALRSSASALFAIKGKPQSDPQAQRWSDLLADEVERFFGEEVTTSLLPYSLKASVIWLPRKHLPDGVLSRGWFPILIADDVPGMVMLLPSRWWPESLRCHWLETSQRRFGRQLEPEAVIHEVRNNSIAEIKADPERAAQFAHRLFESAYGLLEQPGGARHIDVVLRLYEDAASMGHIGALNNLGYLYHHGRHVRADATRAREYFKRAAELGNLDSATNLAISLLQSGQASEHVEAERWLQLASEQGHAQARSLLSDLQRGRSGLLGWLRRLLQRQ